MLVLAGFIVIFGLLFAACYAVYYVGIVGTAVILGGLVLIGLMRGMHRSWHEWMDRKERELGITEETSVRG